MTRPALELVELAHEHLAGLLPEPVYAGGVAVALLVPPESAASCRTKDLDCLFEARNYGELEAVHEQLRGLGAQPDTREDAPRCRWTLAGLTIDVLAPFADAPGPVNEWHSVDADATVFVRLDSGATVRVLDAAHLLGSKILAFRSPYRANTGDWYASKDFEDIATLLDGLEFEVCLDQAPKPLREFVAGFLTEVVESEDARWAIEGHLAGIHPTQSDRVTEVLMGRIGGWLNPEAG